MIAALTVATALVRRVLKVTKTRRRRRRRRRDGHSPSLRTRLLSLNTPLLWRD
jgi:hypothetical protein